MSVIGYEYIPERNLHTPLLTTYARNRTALGREAVQILLRQLRGEPSEPFTPPQGSLICGMTCPCSASRIRQYEELRTARTVRQYADWNLKKDMERRLTECRELDAFAKVMGDFMFMLRGVSDVLLCLREDWHRQAPASEILLCRSVSPWADHTVFRLKQGDLSGVTQREHQPGVFYWLPVCFRDRMFGYCVLRGDREGCFDNVCRSWLKSVENGLEFLRLKADVRYLLQCRVLSGSYDSMTGMYSRDGLKLAYHLMQGSDVAAGVTALYLRCFADRDTLCRADGAEAAVRQLLAAAQVILRFQGGISGRISEYEFLLLLPAGAAEPQQILCMVTAALLREMPVDSFFCTAERFLRDVQPEDFIRSLTDAAGNQAAKYAENRLRPHDAALAELRTEVYQNPLAPYSLGDCAASLGIHPDYFNRRYKECFGQSFHQDCIRARILYAAHLLMHTPMKNAEIAEYCGYTESKYFIRQFSAVTGTSPKAFRIAAEMLSTAQISEKEDSL